MRQTCHAWLTDCSPLLSVRGKDWASGVYGRHHFTSCPNLFSFGLQSIQSARAVQGADIHVACTQGQAHAGKERKDWKILVPPSLKTPLRSRARHSQLEKEFQLTQPGWVPSSGSWATADTKLWGQSWPPWVRWGLSACLHLSDSKTEIAGQGKTLGGSASSLQCMGNLSHKMFIWCFVWWLQRVLLRASERKFINGT